jgi:transposase InsO family protein
MDLYSRSIVGWSIADNMRTELCSSVFNKTYWQRKPPAIGLLHHSGSGSQYTSHDYRQFQFNTPFHQLLIKSGTIHSVVFWVTTQK